MAQARSLTCERLVVRIWLLIEELLLLLSQLLLRNYLRLSILTKMRLRSEVVVTWSLK